MATVRRAAVIGTGTMGPGMGAVLARAGIETALYDVSEDQLEQAKGGGRSPTVLERLEAAQEDGGSLRFETDLEAALDGAGFVIEAVPEKLELKHEVFERFEQLVRRRRSSHRIRAASRSRRSPRRPSTPSAWSACTGRIPRT